jgi:photosystem II stability/assembly factor-like uncharacterized protein
MKLKLIFSLLLLAALTACGPFGNVTLQTPGPAAASGTPFVIVQTPPPPTSTPVVNLPTDTPIPPTSAPASLAVVPEPQILSFHMTDALNGWAVGGSYILRTMDGGLTWLDATPAELAQTGVNVTGRYFLNAETAWVIILGIDTAQGTLYRTTDGGQTWASAAVPFGGGEMKFLDGQRGYILTSLGVAAGSQAVSIYQTADGGATWTRVYTNAPGDPAAADTLPFAGQKSGLTFLNDTHGWVGGNVPMPSNVYLYATQDGGATWTQQSLALPLGFESAMTEVDAPAFFTPLDGILPVRLIAEPLSSVFYVTHDGGLTWTATFALNVTGRYWMANLLELFLWDGGPSLYVSHDTGLNWSRVTTNVNVVDTLAQFEFADASTGWMLTRDAAGHFTFHRTTDGGATWTVLIP